MTAPTRQPPVLTFRSASLVDLPFLMIDATGVKPAVGIGIKTILDYDLTPTLGDYILPADTFIIFQIKRTNMGGLLDHPLARAEKTNIPVRGQIELVDSVNTLIRSPEQQVSNFYAFYSDESLPCDWEIEATVDFNWDSNGWSKSIDIEVSNYADLFADLESPCRPRPGIFIEAKPAGVAGALGYEHLYLVFRDADGLETVIRGGPENDFPPFGSIAVEVGEPMQSSEDARGTSTPEDRGNRRLDLQGRKPEDVWAVMLQQARNIATADIKYSAFFNAQNSNSTVASVLHSVGVNVAETLPTKTNARDLPGIDNLLTLASNLDGTGSDDILVGGAGNSRLFGKAGNDILRGEAGRDILRGGGGGDLIDAGKGDDRTNGGSGRNRITLGPGNDIHDLVTGSGTDFIQDFAVGMDRLALPINTNVNSLTISGANARIMLGNDLLAVLTGVSANLMTSASFVL